jgi:hypothetical protein
LEAPGEATPGGLAAGQTALDRFVGGSHMSRRAIIIAAIIMIPRESGRQRVTV